MLEAGGTDPVTVTELLVSTGTVKKVASTLPPEANDSSFQTDSAAEALDGFDVTPPVR